MKESGKHILLLKSLEKGRHFCNCTFKSTISRKVCAFSMAFKQKLLPHRQKKNQFIHINLMQAKKIPEKCVLACFKPMPLDARDLSCNVLHHAAFISGHSVPLI